MPAPTGTPHECAPACEPWASGSTTLPSPAPDKGWASLTKAELAVAEIVAEGHTNREAAAQLYVSADTVNTHLRHAFAKLGIRSRVELARLVLTRQ
jgi:DNA-binding CsgD family transcriptional regulator